MERKLGEALLKFLEETIEIPEDEALSLAGTIEGPMRDEWRKIVLPGLAASIATWID